MRGTKGNSEKIVRRGRQETELEGQAGARLFTPSANKQCLVYARQWGQSSGPNSPKVMRAF